MGPIIPDFEFLKKLITCPLTRKYFKFPALASDGITYEKEEIIKYLPKHVHDGIINPFSNKTIKYVIDNTILLYLINFIIEIIDNNTEKEPESLNKLCFIFELMLKCPLSKKIMEEPIIFNDGYTYDSESFRDYYIEHKNKRTGYLFGYGVRYSPLTCIEHTDINCTNNIVASLINNYIKKYTEFDCIYYKEYSIDRYITSIKDIKFYKYNEISKLEPYQFKNIVRQLLQTHGINDYIFVFDMQNSFVKTNNIPINKNISNYFEITKYCGVVERAPIFFGGQRFDDTHNISNIREGTHITCIPVSLLHMMAYYKHYDNDKRELKYVFSIDNIDLNIEDQFGLIPLQYAFLSRNNIFVSDILKEYEKRQETIPIILKTEYYKISLYEKELFIEQSYNNLITYFLEAVISRRHTNYVIIKQNIKILFSLMKYMKYTQIDLIKWICYLLCYISYITTDKYFLEYRYRYQREKFNKYIDENIDDNMYLEYEDEKHWCAIMYIIDKLIDQITDVNLILNRGHKERSKFENLECSNSLNSEELEEDKQTTLMHHAIRYNNIHVFEKLISKNICFNNEQFNTSYLELASQWASNDMQYNLTKYMNISQ